MSALLSSSASGRASPDALVAAACHYRTVNLPTLVIAPADSVPVLAIGLVTKDFKASSGKKFKKCHGAQLGFVGVIRQFTVWNFGT
jgi:hypothetical protein